MAIAFVFAGQGSQYSGMGRDLYDNSPAAREIFDISGVADLCFNGTAEELSQTINTQPAMLAMELACTAALNEIGIKADYAAGFSLGEIAALTYAGAFSVADAFTLIRKRAEFMSGCSDGNGGMAAVLKLDNNKVEELAAKYVVYPVNYNCPGQITVAGLSDRLDSFCEAVAENGGRAVKLAVSGAFHSPYMHEAAEKLGEVIPAHTINKLKIPVYSNFTAQPYTDDVCGLLCKQVMSPVRWQQTIENMIADGADTFIEVGAGKVLSGLIKRISKDVKIMNADKFEDIETVKNNVKR